MKNLSLYGIAEEEEAILGLLEMDQGEISEEHEKLKEEIETLIKNKTDSIVGFHQRLGDEIANAKERIKEIQEFVHSRENAMKRLCDYAGSYLMQTGTQGIVGDIFEIRLRKPSKVLKITNEELVPLEYTESETVVKIDKKGLKAAIKGGEIIKGIYLADGAQSISFGKKAVGR